MGLFDGLPEAQMSEGGVYFELGTYDLEVQRCLIKQSRKSGLLFTVEFKILASTVPNQPPGTSVTWQQKMQDQAVAFGAIKAFVAALCGFDPKNDAARIQAELNPHIARITDEAVTAANTFAGRRIRAETYEKRTGSGKDIILPHWHPYTGAPLQGAVSAPAPVQAPPAPAYAPPAPPPYSAPPGVHGAPAPAYAPPAPPPAAPPSFGGYAGYAPPPPPAPAAPPRAPAAPPIPVWNASTQSWEMPR